MEDEEVADNEIDHVETISKLSKQNILLQDRARISRKISRETFRQYNAVEQIASKLCELLKQNNVSSFTKVHESAQHGSVGLLQLSDVHFNELIEQPENKYDFHIASKRLFLFAQRAKTLFKAYNITDIIIVFTGDLLNSDRRLDEIVSAITNRTKASLCAADLLKKFILDLNQEFNVTVASVNGNESRVGENIGWVNKIASDNYDTTIFEILKMLFENSDGVNFLEGNDPTESIIKVGSQNFLALHGHSVLSKSSIEQHVHQIIGKWATKGVNIDYVIFGHVHSARVGDLYGRSSSLCGSNSYSDKDLCLSGRASQNLYVVHDNGLRDGHKIDLQVVEGEEYPVNENLIAYNPKSKGKAKRGKKENERAR